MLERHIHTAVADFLNTALPANSFWFHPANGEYRNPATGARLKRMGVKAGVPDIIVAHNGRMIGIELKAPKKHTTPIQKAVHSQLRDAGCPVFVAHSVNEVALFLETQGIPLNARVAA